MSTTSASRRGAAAIPAELALVLVSLAVTAGYVRVFAGWRWAGTLAAATVGGHLCAIVTRRARIPVWLAVPLSLAVGFVGAVVRFAQDTTRAGLPTGDSLQVLGDRFQEAWAAFPDAIALVPAEGGFFLVAFCACWVTAVAADAFAFRAGAAIEALVPPGVVFITCSVVADERLRVASAAAMAATSVLFLALHRAWMATTRPGWLRPLRSRPMILSAGAVALAVAVAGGVAVATEMPGAYEESLVQYRGRGDNTRITLSPLVDVRGRLAGQSSVVAFRATSPVQTYWRLTSLDTFDGATWTSSRRFSDTDGDLDDAADTGTEVRQEIVIDQLASSYLPAAFSPVRVEGVGGLSWDADSATLLVEQDTTEGQRYSIVSRLALPTAEQLRATTATGRGISNRYLDLPADLPSIIADTAVAFTSGATSDYDKAKALQDNLRRFTYDLGIRTPDGTEPISWFLSIQRGYCEQFSGAFAVMARELGLPSRVAVGFTPGADQPDGSVEVRGQHAHAWPEVWFDGIGWVAFEPTPSRGIPGATYTGVPFQQSGQGPVEEEVAPTTTVAPDQAGPGVTNPIRNPDVGVPAPNFGDGATSAPDSGSPWPRRVLIVALALGAVAVVWPLSVRSLDRRRRHQRRSGAHSGAEQVTVAWSEALDALDQLGLGPDPTETESEYISRAGRAEPQVAAPLARLGAAAVEAGYGDGEPDAVTVQRAWKDAAAIGSTCTAAMDRRQRVRTWFDPRPRHRRVRHQRPGATMTRR